MYQVEQLIMQTHSSKPGIVQYVTNLIMVSIMGASCKNGTTIFVDSTHFLRRNYYACFSCIFLSEWAQA